jgi:hypothetical protein
MTVPTTARAASSSGLFISWAKLRRADTIAERLGMPSITVKYFYRGTPPLLTLWRYFLQTAKTLAILFRRRPRVVIVTNPPVFAIVPVYLYTLVFRARYVVDFHSGCFLERHWRRWSWLQRFFARRALTNLVHNADNAREIEKWRAPHVIFPSLPPDLSAARGAAQAADAPRGPPGRAQVVYICSFKSDEPVDAFLAAASFVPDADFHVTGRPPRDFAAQLPANVKLTGFLGEDEYNRLLAGADLVVALTTRPGTLLYGAQEAIALRKPLVLSRTATLEAVFAGAGRFVENTADGIRAGLVDALARRNDLERSMIEFARRYQAEGEARLEELQEMLAAGSRAERSGPTAPNSGKIGP